MRKSLKVLLSLVAVLTFCGSAWAQKITVRGEVSDANGDPIPGVGVVIQGTLTGVETDINGAYTITVPSKETVLVFSFLGMQTVERKVNGKGVINVIMQEDRNFLEEVVVVGYGQQKKVHMTGSVSAVSANELKKTTVTNVSQSLVGKLPGVITQQSLGQPGSDQVSILVRGFSSYNDSGTVLVLVDGVERDMNLINPADVESISVLKDAASCAVYGMRGANGVIIVTTKRGGDEGGATVNYSGRITLSQPTALPTMMNGEQYMKYYNLGYQLDKIMDGELNPEPYFTAEEIAAVSNGDTSDGLENTNWTEPLYRITPTHQHNISVSGGTKKVKYYVSGGYQDQRGFLTDNYNKRTNFRSNIDVQASRDVKVSFNVGGVVNTYNQPGTMSFANGQLGGTVPFCLMYALPFVPKYYNGMATSPMRTAGSFVANAEYGAKHSGFSTSTRTKFDLSANITYSVPFIKGLDLSFAYSWDWTDLDSKTMSYGYKVMAFDFATRTYTERACSNALETGNLNVGNQKFVQQVYRPTVSYSNTFGKHGVSAVVIYELQDYTSRNFSGGRKEYDFFDLPYLSYGSPSTATVSESAGVSASDGLVGRFNYMYDEKYLFETSFRYDGSYKFAPGKMHALFPSVSVGWVASREQFFKELFPAVSLFKLRASFGEVGNDNCSAWAWRKSFALNQNAVAFGQTAQSSLYNTVAYPNPYLTWERIQTTNLGFEFNAWKGLLGLEFDVFYKHTYDILDTVASAYPPSLGGNYPSYENTGEFDNRGFELSLNHANKIGEVEYRVTGNVSWARNRILKKNQAANTLPWQDVVGTSLGSVWGLKSDGLYQTQEEIDNSPAPIGVTPKLGDIKWVDYNGDGKITSDDNVIIARSWRPELMYSMQFDFNWKGFDLAIQLQGAALCDKLLLGSWANGVTDANPLTRPWYAGYDNAPLYLVEGAWRPDHTDAEYPRLSVNGSSYSNNYKVSDFWARNGAYLRLKNVTLGYNLPTRLMRKVNCKGLRLFLNGTNLLTLNEFKYLDPESPNVVTGYYPQQRTYTFGVDLTF